MQRAPEKLQRASVKLRSGCGGESPKGFNVNNHGCNPWHKHNNNPSYPFWFTTGRSQHLWQTMDNDKLIPEKLLTVPLPYLEIHTDDAVKLNLKSGDMAEVFNEEGSCLALVYVNDATKPGLVFGIMYHAKGTMNNLTSSYTDPKTTIPWYKGTKVAVKKYTGKLDDAIKTVSLLSNNDFTTQ